MQIQWESPTAALMTVAGTPCSVAYPCKAKLAAGHDAHMSQNALSPRVTMSHGEAQALLSQHNHAAVA